MTDATTTTVPTYRESWERYWTGVSEPGAPLWDSDPTEAVLADLPRFLPHLDAGLPLIDVGCGNGTQSPALARSGARVLGVDISPAGIALCQANHGAPGLEFRVLDLLDRHAVASLHAELGDMNLYIRTVLHQLGDSDRQPAIHNLATLLGARGRAFVFELSHAAEAYFNYLFVEFAGPPPKLDRVLGSGIRPAALADGELKALFAGAGCTALSTGKSAVHSTLTLPAGYRAMIPADWAVFGRA